LPYPPYFIISFVLILGISIEYAEWLAAYNSTGSPAGVEVLAHIYIDGEITHGPIAISGAGAYPPITLRSFPGKDGTLKLASQGTLITVGAGGNLTLGGSLNLVGQGLDVKNKNNNLVRVENGGSLTLADKAVIKDNKSAGNGGGVYVGENGTFTMYGGVIMGNSADYVGGGVFIDESGHFTKTDGTIYGAYSGDVADDLENFAAYGEGHVVYVNLAYPAPYRNTTVERRRPCPTATSKVTTSPPATGNGGRPRSGEPKAVPPGCGAGRTYGSWARKREFTRRGFTEAAGGNNTGALRGQSNRRFVMVNLLLYESGICGSGFSFHPARRTVYRDR
jgi:hypothetical protein